MKPVLLLRAYRGDCVWELWDCGGDHIAEVQIE
jgi:hypothetical protein